MGRPEDRYRALQVRDSIRTAKMEVLEELKVLGDIEVTGDFSVSGFRTGMSTDNVNDTAPTEAELTAAFGAPAEVGEAFIGVVKDNDEDTNCFLVVSNGTSYFFHKFTKAT